MFSMIVGVATFRMGIAAPSHNSSFIYVCIYTIFVTFVIFVDSIACVLSYC